VPNACYLTGDQSPKLGYSLSPRPRNGLLSSHNAKLYICIPLGLLISSSA
jgi:hypothetical protein